MKLAIVLVACTGCAAIGSRVIPSSRTYTYDAPVTVEVRSDPDGATIVDERGTVIGTAPTTISARHPVERTRRSRSRAGIALGCVADAAIGVLGMVKWAQGVSTTVDDGTPFGRVELDVFSSWKQRVILVGASLHLMDCMIVTISRWGVTRDEEDTRDSLQVRKRPFDREVVSERLLPRTIKVEARWRDWSPVRGTIEIPAHTFLTLRRGNAGTFDDALIRHVRANGALDAEGLYRAGQAFLKMARETKVREHAEQAIGQFEKYLATENVPDARRTELAPLIAELRGIK